MHRQMIARLAALAIFVLSCLSCAVARAAQAEPGDAAPTGDASPSLDPKTLSPATAETQSLKSLPTTLGLPVLVNVSVFVLELEEFDDVKGEFEATTDLRLRWRDARLAKPGAGASYEEYRGRAADERLSTMWQPNVNVSNRQELLGYTSRRLRIYRDGSIETIERSTAKLDADVDVEKFPFDEQTLPLNVIVREQTTDEVMLRFDRDDERFSRTARDIKLPGWTVGDVDLDSTLVSGWNGDRYASVIAGIQVDRVPSTGLTTIFIPLIASLLIPLLALWMNRPTAEGFEIPAFELANMGIGGLFSVIALSFAVSSAYGTVAGSDNTVTRLFALNYATLAISLSIMVLLFRFNLLQRLYGRYVQEQTFRFLLWALPVLTLGTSLAFVLVAAC